MAPRIKVTEFVASTARYAKKAATAADKNKNGKLTRTEAKSLPRDLRDDYGRQAARKSTITVAGFASDQAAYVAASGRKADKNKDGILSAIEAKSLPTSLKNNYADYAASQTAPATPATGAAGPLVGKGKGTSDTLGGKAVTRLSLASWVPTLVGKLSAEAGGMSTYAAAWKCAPADVAAVLAHPGTHLDFLNDALFHGTGSTLQRDYPTYYTPAGLTASPITASDALRELTASFQANVSGSPGPKVPGGGAAATDPKALARVVADTSKLFNAVSEPGSKLLKLSWTNHDDASFDGVFALNASTGQIKALGFFSEP